MEERASLSCKNEGVRIAVIGAGYVGLTTASCLAALGHRVTCIDVDTDRIRELREGRPFFYEPGLENLVGNGAAQGNLAFTTDYPTGLEGAGIIFITVGTPSGEGGAPDLDAFRSAITCLMEHLQQDVILVVKSTVPVGTCDWLAELFRRKNFPHQVEVVSNPEFLREGSALYDFFQPDRIVIGADRPEAGRKVRDIYEQIPAPVLMTTRRTAELIKYASNAFLATKISLINEISHLCSHLGVNVKDVSRGVGMDRRIGPGYLQAGIGFGGSCFPKDLAALAWMFEREGLKPRILKAVLEVNALQSQVVATCLRDILGTLKNRRIALFGLAFKPDTDDVRESPALAVARHLIREGVKVRGFDPKAGSMAAAELPELEVVADPYDAASAADAVVVATDWKEFAVLDYARVKSVMRRPIIFDGRNLLDPKTLLSLGFTYFGVGR